MPKQKIIPILNKLRKLYPGAHCELFHNSAYQLLIATMLSAQCTDKRVNLVTPELFNQAPDAASMLKLGYDEVSKMIKSCGFFQTKAQNIIKTSELLLQKYNGEVPKTESELVALPGVGRKTANVVLYNAFGIQTIAVDTHVFRVSQRLGLAKGKTPDQIETQLTKIIPKKYWGEAHHLFIFHGRYHCTARKPKCETCPLTKECDFWSKPKS